MKDELIINLVVLCICGGICSAIASSKGRNPVGWFFGGFIGIIGIIIVACLPNLKEKKSREDAIDRENRRLREQLYQEQMKAETFRRHAIERLDVHDVHLGVDTRTTTNTLTGPQGDAPLNLGFDGWSDQGTQSGAGSRPLGSSGYPDAAPGLPPPQAPATQQTIVRNWFYAMNGQSLGPISENELGEYIRNRHVTAQTLVWTEQLGEWKAAGQIAHLQQWFRV